MYIVEGGHYSDFSFTDIERFEQHGPFDTYQQAYDSWKRNMWLNVDDGQHRLEIKEVKAMTPGTSPEDSKRLMSWNIRTA